MKSVCDVCAACTVSNVNIDSALVVMLLNSPTIIVKLMIILFPSSWWCGAACGRWIIPRGTPGTVGCDLIQAFPTTHAPLSFCFCLCPKFAVASIAPPPPAPAARPHLSPRTGRASTHAAARIRRPRPSWRGIQRTGRRVTSVGDLQGKPPFDFVESG